MTLTADFEAKYRFSEDPWQTLSDEKSPYYDWLFEQVKLVADEGRSLRLLDIGCGEGHFTRRLSQLGRDTLGVDISATAIERAKEKYPSLRFEALNFSKKISGLGKFDIINCSQVIYYLSPTELQSFMRNVYDILKPDGVLVLSANCSGGSYFEPDEFQAICEGYFSPLLRSTHGHHQLFAGQMRRSKVCVTVDYEVMEHNGNLFLSPDLWRREVLDPTDGLMDACETAGAKVTIFAEMAQYWFLKKHAPSVAVEIEAQWQDAVRRGYDVQVHLHTRWLIEAGACLGKDNQIMLAMDFARIHDLTDDRIKKVLVRAKSDLETLLRPVHDSYRANSFRAGKYQIQPHDRVFPILKEVGFVCDSSVWHGGFLSAYDRNPGFDFRTLWHPTKPYWPNRHDINRLAVKADSHGVLELPILSYNRQQWCFDHLDRRELFGLYMAHRAGMPVAVMIGHTKQISPVVLDNLKGALTAIAATGAEFQNFRDVASVLLDDKALDNELAALLRYNKRSLASPQEIWDKLPAHHKTKVNLLVQEIEKNTVSNSEISILDAGCGTGELLTFPLVHSLGQRQGYRILATDVDTASVDRAVERAAAHGLTQVEFRNARVNDITDAFDIVVCSEVLECLTDPQGLVRDLAARVAPNGLLILTTPNGYGYKEIERRVLSGVYGLVMASPAFVRKALLKARQMLRRRLAPPSGGAGVQVIGTLNYENDTHIQFFRLSRLRRMVEQAGYEVVQVYNTQPLGGILGSILDQKLGLDTRVQSWPTWAAAGWFLVARRKP